MSKFEVHRNLGKYQQTSMMWYLQLDAFKVAELQFSYSSVYKFDLCKVYKSIAIGSPIEFEWMSSMSTEQCPGMYRFF